jgi:hypothetical protein
MTLFMRRSPRAARQSGGYDAKSEPASETIDTADPDVSAEREDDKLSPQGSGKALPRNVSPAKGLNHFN